MKNFLFFFILLLILISKISNSLEEDEISDFLLWKKMKKKFEMEKNEKKSDNYLNNEDEDYDKEDEDYGKMIKKKKKIKKKEKFNEINDHSEDNEDIFEESDDLYYEKMLERKRNNKKKKYNENSDNNFEKIKNRRKEGNRIKKNNNKKKNKHLEYFSHKIPENIEKLGLKRPSQDNFNEDSSTINNILEKKQEIMNKFNIIIWGEKHPFFSHWIEVVSEFSPRGKIVDERFWEISKNVLIEKSDFIEKDVNIEKEFLYTGFIKYEEKLKEYDIHLGDYWVPFIGARKKKSFENNDDDEIEVKTDL